LMPALADHPGSRREVHFGDSRLLPLGTGHDAVETLNARAARCEAASACVLASSNEAALPLAIKSSNFAPP
jgi:hypothetical protein